jgi:signal transduction histidine kinase
MAPRIGRVDRYERPGVMGESLSQTASRGPAALWPRCTKVHARPVRVEVTQELSRSPDSAGDVEVRVEHLTRGADLSHVAELPSQRRDEILGRWLVATGIQPFHLGRRADAVADHIPELFDALVALMQRSAPRWLTPGPPLDNPAVLAAAQAHARRRFEQGLAAADVVVEFRLLRQEIGRALRLHLPSGAPPDDVVGAELLVNDALDGAISLALSALSRQIEELREEFLATVVHDLRQPITTIKGHHQLALRRLIGDTPDLERAADFLNRAEAETDRLGRLVGQLSDASRVALGRLEVRAAQVDLAELLHDVVERLDPVAAGRVRISSSPEGLDARGEYDAELLDRVVTNLLNNAFKYSPPDSPIQITVQDDEDALHVSLQDNGIGIALDQMGILFHRNRRAKKRWSKALRVSVWASIYREESSKPTVAVSGRNPRERIRAQPSTCFCRGPQLLRRPGRCRSGRERPSR